MAFDDKTQFDYLFDALAQKYPALAASDGQTTTFQFMELPTEANWAANNDANAFAIADATSLSLDGFFAHGGSLSTAYQDFVLSIAPSAGSDNPDYKQAAQLVQAEDQALSNTISDALGQFKVFQAQNPGQTMTYHDWLADPDFDGPDWANKIQIQRQKRNDQARKMQQILNAIDQPLAAAQAAANPWSQTMPISQGGQVVNVPLTTISGNLPQDLSNWMAYAPDEYDFDVTIKATDIIKSPWKTTYTTQTSFRPCYGFSTSTTIDSTRIVQDKNYTLRFRAKGLNSYDIERGAWFHEDLVVPTTAIVQGSTFTNDGFFGYAGSLHLIPESVLVMYRPTIELTVSTDVYKEEIEGSITASLDWLDLFGMRFDLKAGASITPLVTDEITTITIAAPATAAPQIVGVLSKVCWNKNAPSPQLLRAERQAYSALAAAFSA
jgi:hypothetical protein